MYDILNILHLILWNVKEICYVLTCILVAVISMQLLDFLMVVNSWEYLYRYKPLFYCLYISNKQY